ncbi:hypothetical protein T265_13401, partial [Opisthorchis viverrini]
MRSIIHLVQYASGPSALPNPLLGCAAAIRLTLTSQSFFHFMLGGIPHGSRFDRSWSGAATTEKPIPRKADQQFGTLAGLVSSQELISRKSGPYSHAVQLSLTSFLGANIPCAPLARLKHEAAWYSTFSGLETSKPRDSAGFQ